MVSPSSRAQLSSCSYITNILTCDKHSSLTDFPGKGHHLPLSELLQHLMTVLDSHQWCYLFVHFNSLYTTQWSCDQVIHGSQMVHPWISHVLYDQKAGLEVTSFCVAKPFTHMHLSFAVYLIGTYTASDKALCEKYQRPPCLQGCVDTVCMAKCLSGTGKQQDQYIRNTDHGGIQALHIQYQGQILI